MPPTNPTRQEPPQGATSPTSALGRVEQENAATDLLRSVAGIPVAPPELVKEAGIWNLAYKPRPLWAYSIPPPSPVRWLGVDEEIEHWGGVLGLARVTRDSYEFMEAHGHGTTHRPPASEA